MPVSTLTSKGQITVPVEIRERLGLRQGDRLVFVLEADGRVVVRRDDDGEGRRLEGLLRHLAPSEPVSVEEMRAAVRRRAGRSLGR
jgi:AbrB family looped-hinge helix DNA binding protein